MLKRVAVLALAVVGVFLAYSYGPALTGFLVFNENITREQALHFVSEDLKSVQGAEARIVSVGQSNGKWLVDVLLSFDSHSSCPKLERRSYELLPIGHRTEKIISDCLPRSPMAYREEALIASAKSLAVPYGSYGCAFYLADYDADEAKAYCPAVDAAVFASFARGLPKESWAVFWNTGGVTRSAALDKYGGLIKSQ